METSVSFPSEWVLVHGLFKAAHWRDTSERRAGAFATHAETLGVHDYKWFDGRRRNLANRLIRLKRGTARPVDAVEIISVNEAALRSSLASESGRKCWHEVGSCESWGFDTDSSFILIGRPRQLLASDESGQNILWFGNGLSRLSQTQFIEHYTTRHGPLVAGHAQVTGLRGYIQVPSEQEETCGALRDLGLGQARPPAVFAQLVVGTPPLSLAAFKSRRAVTREIEADEKRHIDFASSMLLLTP
jgi:hypothetical protein